MIEEQVRTACRSARARTNGRSTLDHIVIGAKTAILTAIKRPTKKIEIHMMRLCLLYGNQLDPEEQVMHTHSTQLS